jgi:hypothetical protein
VVVHENAHQWFGDSVALENWDDIWLHEGFATYLEWMWSEYNGEVTAQERFDFTDNFYPATSSVWRVKPGDPDNSYIVQKVEGTAAVGGRMPLNREPLTAEQIGLLRQWISEGAER